MNEAKFENIRRLRPLQARFYRLLGKQAPKPVHPVLVRIYGAPLALIINQLLFWDGMGAREDGYIFKTEKDFIEEIGLSPAQQKYAIRKGKQYGFLEVVRKGVPAKRHYRIHFEELVATTIRLAKIKGIYLSKGYFAAGEINQTITERTQAISNRKSNTSSIGKIIDQRFRKR